MKSPKDMRVIQIDITNACPNKCSNCTRFCGNHKKPFFMDFDTFRRAVDSLVGFDGTIGMMGGEPTMHPEFERFARYLDSKLPPIDRKKKNDFIYPQDRFIDAIHNQEYENRTPSFHRSGAHTVVRGAGLWSMVGEGYRKNYEIIQDIFKHQPINDHENIMHHQPALIARKDLGISDEEWFKLRDKCWINQQWSATITPKGAFFCEIAGALDMLFDGPGGWPIEPGWWKREEKDFGEQLQWCELCGLALETFSRDAREEIDDVSPTLYEKLKEIGSPKLKQGKINLIEINDGVIAEKSKAGNKLLHEGLIFAESYESRFGGTKSSLYPESFVEALILEEKEVDKNVVRTIENNINVFSRAYIVVNNSEIADEYKKLFNEEDRVIISVKKNFGHAVNYLLQQVTECEYIVLHTTNVEFSEKAFEKLGRCIINPGTLHYKDFSRQSSEENEYISNVKEMTEGYVLLFNKNAISLREMGYDGVSYCKDFEEMIGKWSPAKIVPFSNAMNYSVPEIYVTKGTRYALYGAGGRTRYVINCLKSIGEAPVMIVDSDEKKWNSTVCDYVVESPDALFQRASDYDKVIITSRFYYGEIKEQLLNMGIDVNRISMGEKNENI